MADTDKVFDVGEDCPTTNGSNDDDDVSVPDDLSDFKKQWFVSFVKWHKTKCYVLASRLDSDKIDQLKAESLSESIFLNFLMFHDKCHFQRANFEVAERDKVDHPFMCGTGTDHNFHSLGNIFIQYGPHYFVDNTDVKGRTKEELAELRERPWKPHPSGDDSGH